MSLSLSSLSIAKHIKLLIVVGILFVAIDGLYLTLVQGFFQQQIQLVQGSNLEIHYGGAILAYLFLVGGLYYFILQEKKSPTQAALLGLVIYGVYEYTNLSILKKWMWKTTFLDTIWGGVLFYVTTFLFYQLRPLLQI